MSKRKKNLRPSWQIKVARAWFGLLALTVLGCLVYETTQMTSNDWKQIGYLVGILATATITFWSYDVMVGGDGTTNFTGGR